MIKKSKKVKILYSFFLITFSFSITTEDIYDNSYALIIGIDKYQNVRGLDYAVKDAVDIQTMLIDIFHFKQDNIVLLQNEEATKTNIIQEFSNITNNFLRSNFCANSKSRSSWPGTAMIAPVP